MRAANMFAVRFTPTRSRGSIFGCNGQWLASFTTSAPSTPTSISTKSAFAGLSASPKARSTAATGMAARRPEPCGPECRRLCSCRASSAPRSAARCGEPALAASPSNLLSLSLVDKSDVHKLRGVALKLARISSRDRVRRHEFRCVSAKHIIRLAKDRGSTIALKKSSLPVAPPVFEFQGHEASDRDGEIEWPDNGLQIGKAAGKWVEQRDVAVAGGGQCREAEIERRGEFARAGRGGRQVGKSAGGQLPHEAEARPEHRRQAKIHYDRALQTMERNTARRVDRVRHDPSKSRENEYESALVKHARDNRRPPPAERSARRRGRQP